MDRAKHSMDLKRTNTTQSRGTDAPPAPTVGGDPPLVTDEAEGSGLVSNEQHAAVTAWGVGTILAGDQPYYGAIHETVLLQTDRGRYVLRGYRHRDRAPVEREHAVIAHVRQHGVPAIAPLPLRSGDTILDLQDRRYALFPSAPGRQFRKGELGMAEARAMGAILAQVHQALRSLPERWATRRSFAVDHANTIARLDMLEAVIRGRTDGNPVHSSALARLMVQRRWITALSPAAAVDFGGLDQQVLHGDFQETNLFFADGQVSAVIDWDQTYVAPRGWEVVRTLHYAFGFAPALCRSFLAAYRRALPLSAKCSQTNHAAWSRWASAVVGSGSHGLPM